MNRYGATARKHWTQHRPQDLSRLNDPTGYFTTLGEEIEQQVLTLSSQLAGPDPAGEGYLEKVARLNAATSRAEESVLTEMVWTSTTQEETEDAENLAPSRTDAFQQQIAAALQTP
jgi:hypothetical protein